MTARASRVARSAATEVGRWLLRRRLERLLGAAARLEARVRLLWFYGHAAAAQGPARELAELDAELVRLRQRLGLAPVKRRPASVGCPIRRVG